MFPYTATDIFALLLLFYRWRPLHDRSSADVGALQKRSRLLCCPEKNQMQRRKESLIMTPKSKLAAVALAQFLPPRRLS